MLENLRNIFNMSPTEKQIEAFMEAIRSNDLAAVKNTLDQRPDAVAWTGIHGWKPLMVAAQVSERAPIAALLIERGAGIDDRNFEGNTALHGALQSLYQTTAQLLVDKGADLNIRNKEGHSALTCALHAGRTDKVEEWAAKGGDLRVRDNDGLTLAMLYLRSPAMYAAASCPEPFKKNLSLLLPEITDFEAVDKDNKTVLDYAHETRNATAVRILGELRAAAQEKIAAKRALEKKAEHERALQDTDFSRGLRKPMPLPKRPDFRHKP